MKKLFTFLAIALVAVCASAQTLQFVDASGNVITDGSTITMNTVEEDVFGDAMIPLKGLYVKNTGSAAASVNMTVEVTEFPGGSFQCCLGDQCKSLTKLGTLNITGVSVAAGATMEVTQTEWVPTSKTAYGTCTVTFTLGLSPSVTVKFVNEDPSSKTLKGDVNEDGKVDASDITALMGIILNN